MSEKNVEIFVEPDDERKVSSFVFWNKTRFFVMALSLLCLTMDQINDFTFNFTVICMDEKFLDNPTEKSWLFSSMGIGNLIGLIPSVALFERIGFKMTYTGYGLISALSSLLFPLCVYIGFYATLFCRILQGVGIALLYTIFAHVAKVWAPNVDIGMALAIMSCYFQIANIIAMSASGFLCSSSLGWRSIYYIFGAITLLSHIVFIFFYADVPDQHRNVSNKELTKINAGKQSSTKKTEKVPYKQLCTDWCVISAWLSTAGRNSAFYVLVLYGPTYLNDVLKFNVKGTGIAAALPFLLNAGAKCLSGKLTDSLYMFSDKAKFVGCTSTSIIALAVGFVVMAFTTNKIIAQIAYTTAITLSGLSILGNVKCLQLRCLQHAHFATSVLSFVACVVQFLVPFAVGFIAPNNTPEEWSRLFLVASGVMIVLNIPFPILTTSQPAEYTKKKQDLSSCHL